MIDETIYPPRPEAWDGRWEHDWRPTTATHAVFKCQKCSAVGFAPHPPPHNGCLGDPA